MVRVKKGDTVLVISGKEKGKTGKVDRILPREGRVLVTGINLVVRHAKPRPNVRQAGRVQKEMPLHLSKVALVCPKCSKPARVGHTRLEDGTWVRVCKQCKNTID